MATTTKATHTPGPWRLRGRYIETDLDGGNTICTVSDWLDKYGIEQEANARLIAAAPELLESLQETLSQIKTITHNWIEDDLNNLIKERADAVIRKAKGEL